MGTADSSRAVRVQRLVDSIIVLWGWRRWLAAFAAGAASALALAPAFFLPLLWFWWLAQDVLRSSSAAHGGNQPGSAPGRPGAGAGKPAREDTRDADIDPLIN